MISECASYLSSFHFPVFLLVRSSGHCIHGWSFPSLDLTVGHGFLCSFSFFPARSKSLVFKSFGARGKEWPVGHPHGDRS